VKALLIAVLAIGLAAGAAGAAEEKGAAKAHTLDPIIVTASRADEDTLAYQGSATALQSSKSVDVIDQRQIALSGARNLPELLKGQVGVDVREYMGNGKTAQVDLRGFGETALSNTLILIDGRRTNQVDMSGVDWSQINIDAVERVEILRGPQTVLYGDNAVGGVINIITKRGKGVKPEIGLKYETGSYHYNAYGVNATGGTELMDYFFNFTTSKTDGFRWNSDLDNVDLNGTLTMRPAEYLDLKCDAGLHRDWFGLPGAVTDVQIDQDGIRAVDTPNNRRKTEDMYLMPGFNVHYAPEWGSFSFAADFPLRDRRTAGVFDFGYWNEIDDHITTFGVTPRAIVEFPVFEMKNRLTAGVDCYQYTDKISSSNWINALIAGDGWRKDRVVVTEETTGLYVTDTLSITPELTVNGGARAEWASYRFDQQAIAQSLNNKRLFAYAFDGGINYKYNETSAVYGSVARGFRLPAVDEWYQTFMVTPWGNVNGGLNMDLDTQESMNYEAGVRDHTLKWLKVNADYFLLDTRHELTYDPINFVNAVYDRTMRHGLELETHVLPVDNLDIYANYTYEKAFFVGSHFAGNTVPLVPCHKLTGGIVYTFMDCVDVHYIFRFVGPRYFISDPLNLSRQMKQYITNDIKLAYRKHGLEIYGALNNIFDYEYSEIGSWGQYFPANGRNFVAGVKYKF